MKTITSSIGFQDQGGNVLANGSIIFTLPQGVYAIAGGGQVFGSSIIINLDAAGKIPTGKQLWASDELSPQTPYNINLCNVANGLGQVGSGTWLITGASPIDLSQMVNTSAGISYVSPIVVNSTSTQTINSALTVTGALTAASETVTGNVSVGGTVTAASFTNNLSAFAPTTSAQLAGVISDETGSGPLVFGTSPTLTTPTLTTPIITAPGATFNGSTSGTLTVKAAAVSGSSVATFPDGSGTVILDGTTQTLTGKTYGGVTQSKQVFTASGTFTIPANITSVKATVIGGGGAGGGANTSNGGGGGAGGAAIRYLSGLTPGSTLTVTVGTGGTGVSNAPGNAGTSSTVASGTQTIATITGAGGSGGVQGAPIATGGSGGGATGGDINNPGNPGGWALVTNTGGVGAASYFGGAGAIGFIGGGSAGLAPGAGGGGAGSGATSAGGAGANGIVIFEWVN